MTTRSSCNIHAGNIGSEMSARHNAFMYSAIKSCKTMRRNVEDYLKVSASLRKSGRVHSDWSHGTGGAKRRT